MERMMSEYVPNDRTENTLTPYETSTKTTRTLDHLQFGWRYNEMYINQRQTTSKPPPLQEDHEQPIKKYFTLPYPRQPGPGLVLTSQHALVPSNYPSWSWLSSASNTFPVSPHVYYPMMNTRRQTWNQSINPRYPYTTQRWSQNEFVPRSPEEWGKDNVPAGDVAQSAGVTEALQRQETREEWQSVSIIKEFFSIEDGHRQIVDERKEREETNTDQDVQQIMHDVPKKDDESASKEDIEGESGAREDTIPTSEHNKVVDGPSTQQSDKLHSCEKCSKTFRKLGNLRRHMITHGSAKSFICPQCNKAFNRASNLNTHMKIHSSYKPHKCDFCGKGFHQKIDKRIHHYTHTGEKPHKCQTCGRGFKQLTHLNYHMRTHSDKKMYHCTQCGKGFNQKGNLQAHIYGHTGERPFKCEICGKGFTLRSTLNTHVRTHAKIKPFVCEYCDKAFYQKNSLKIHHIASHPTVNGKSIL